MSKQRHHEALLITSAQPSHLEEVHDRRVQYTITMSLRIVCFFLIIVLPGWPLKGIAFAAAAVLPWVAVQAANLPYRMAHAPRFLDHERPQIEGGKQELGPPGQPE